MSSRRELRPRRSPAEQRHARSNASECHASACWSEPTGRPIEKVKIASRCSSIRSGSSAGARVATCGSIRCIAKTLWSFSPISTRQPLRFGSSDHRAGWQMNRKTDQIRAAWAAGNRIAALRIAARFFDRSTDTKTFKRGIDAYNNPDFYRQLGKDPEQIMAAALEGLAKRFGL